MTTVHDPGGRARGGFASAVPDHSDLAPAGYELLEEIGRGARHVVYRARRGELDVAIKVGTSPIRGPSDPELLRARREAGILGCLRHRALPRVFEVGVVGGRPFLVLEHVRGVVLSEALLQGPVSPPRVIRLAVELAGALHEIHRHGLVHRDVHPGNVIVDDTGGLRLFDFELVGRCGSEAEPAAALGTLAYASPEQTGALARPVDSRSDLYAAGAVLYECATGRTPFDASDAAEMIRLHAVAPVPRADSVHPGVSGALSSVLDRLLAKDPDDRYQNADALLRDLENLDQAGRSPAAPDVQVSRVGAASRAAPALVGRVSELAEIERRWRMAKTGAGGLVLLEGDAGTGKTRLVAEVVGRLRATGELCVVAGGVEGDPNPLSAFGTAADALIHGLADVSDDAPRRLAEALGERGRLLKGVSPGLGALFADLPDLPESAERHSLIDAAALLFLHAARLAGPIALVMDDLHWLDPGSWEIVARLATQAREAPVLVVGAGRTGHESVVRMLRVLEEADPSAGSLRIAPLGRRTVEELVVQMLGGGEPAATVIDRVTAGTGGNPLMVFEYVRAMLDAGVLVPHWGSWVADEAALDHLDLPGEVVRLILLRSRRLTEQTRHLLRVAAVVGPRFDSSVVAAVAGSSEQDVLRAMVEATACHLVEPLGPTLRRFVHDCVREAFLGELDEATERALHVGIAEQTDASARPESERAFTVARHLALGGPVSPPEPAYEANRRAGVLAWQRCAFADARRFLEDALHFAEPAGRTRDVETRELLARVLMHQADYEGALGLLADALEFVDEGPVRARLHAAAALSLCELLDIRRSAEQVRLALRAMGITPRFSLPAVVKAVWDGLLGLIGRRLGIRPSANDEARAQVLARIYVAGLRSAQQGGRALEGLHMGLRLFGCTRRLAPGYDLVSGLVYTSILIAPFTFVARWLVDEADAIARDAGDPASVAHAAWGRGVRDYHRASGTAGGSEPQIRFVEEHGTWARKIEVQAACWGVGWDLAMRGYSREALPWLQGGTRDAGRLLNSEYEAMAAVALAQLGRQAEGARRLDTAVRAREAERSAFQVCLVEGHRALFHAECGEYGPAFWEAVRELETRRPLLMGMLYVWTQTFDVALVHARIEECQSAPAADRPPLYRELRRAVRRLGWVTWSSSLYGHYLVGRGVEHALRGRTRRALEVLSRAEAHASRSDAPSVRFEVERQRARIYRDLGDEPAARAEAQRALRLARERGWANRERRLRAEFSFLHSASASDSGQKVAAGRSEAWLRTLVDVSLLSARRLPGSKDRIRAILDSSVRLLKADRGFLFLAREGMDDLALELGRDASQHDLTGSDTVSSAAVERARRGHETVRVNGTADGQALGSQSILEQGLLSILATPLLYGGRLMGVLYFDSTAAKGMFGPDDVDVVRALASQVAVALETARTAQHDVYRRIASNAGGAVFQGLWHPGGATRLPFVSDPQRAWVDLVAAARVGPGELLGRVHADDRAAFLASLQLLTSGERAQWRWTGRIHERDGVRWVRAAAFAERLPDRTLRVEGLLLDVSDLKRAEEGLKEAHALLERRVDERTAEVRALARKMLSIQEEERSRIAREIHDQLGQTLTVLKFQLARLREQPAHSEEELRAGLRGIEGHVEGTVQTVRHFTSLLRPQVLDDLGLVAAMEWQVGDFRRRTGIECRLDAEVDAVQLDRERSTALFRVLQEALTNAARHACASRIRVSLREDDRSVLLRVHDDGRGFREEEAARTSGLGINGMRERMLQWGGTFRITTAAGEGTTVAAVLPRDTGVDP